MSLDVFKLRQALVRWFSLPQGVVSLQRAARRLSEVYHEYASDGEDVSGERATTLSIRGFQDSLYYSRCETARDFCRQIDSAFVSYWTGAVFAVGVVPPVSPPCPNVGGNGVFGTEISSQVTAVQRGVLYDALLPIVSFSGGSASSKAAQVAEALDSATRRAVEVTITGMDTSPPPGPYSITNTCTVF